jgi:prophage regulatory protein
MSSSAFLLPKAASTALAPNPRLAPRQSPPAANAVLPVQPPPAQAERRTYVRLGAVRAQTGLTTSTIYRYKKLGWFPEPHRLGPRTVGWLQSDIDQWLASREAA